jgi:hypothetical protein
LFSDFIIFADESGSPVTNGLDPDFPIFVLVFVVIRKDVYACEVVPALQKLKFNFTGHDQIILHERDIRRSEKAFSFLRTDPLMRASFMEQVNALVESANLEVIVSIIDKRSLVQRYADPWDPYELALQFCLEQARNRIGSASAAGDIIHAVFESRGAAEDAALELAFRRIVSNEGRLGRAPPRGWRTISFQDFVWEPVFADKRSNSSGLQLADLFARPLGLQYLRPDQPNRAADIIRKKIPARCYKVFPKS